MSRMAALMVSAAVLFSAEAAAAVSLTNRDDRDNKIMIIEGDKRQEHVLVPSAVLEGICQKGCVVRLNDNESDEYELEGNEVVSIEQGYLYYDGPDAPSEPSPGNGEQGRKK